MAPSPQRPRRTGAAAFAPIVVAICAIILVRELMAALTPGLNAVIAFIVALAVGYAAYVAVERAITRRGGDGGSGA